MPRPAGVLISHETYRQVRGLFSVEALAPMHVRGKTEPVQTYRVLDAKPIAFLQETRGVEGVETPLVGRTREMQALKDAFRSNSNIPWKSADYHCGRGWFGQEPIII